MGAALPAASGPTWRESSRLAGLRGGQEARGAGAVPRLARWLSLHQAPEIIFGAPSRGRTVWTPAGRTLRIVLPGQ